MDREKIIKEYEDYVNSYISLITSHDYELEMHKAVLALLKEQEIVRCKDCKKRETMYCPFYWRYKGTKYDDWFCADGERR